MEAGLRVLIYRYSDIQNARHAWTLANYLADNNCDVTVVCAESDGEPVSGLSSKIKLIGVDLKNTSGKLARQFAGAKGLKRCLMKDQYDVLYVIDSWSLPSCFIATNGSMRFRNCKTVYHTFDWLEPGRVSPVHTYLESRICRQADLVVNADRSRARLQRTMYRLDKTPLFVQNSLSRRQELPDMDLDLRSELIGGPLSGNEMLMIYPTAVSNAASSERLAYELIQAFDGLPAYYYLLLFYKEGSEYDRCKGLVDELGLANRVRFIEPVPFEKLMNYLGCSDLGAILYDDSSSSGYFMCNADKLSLLIASGTPYVASDFPNLESITYKYSLGSCCNAKDPGQIRKSIEELVAGEPSVSERKEKVRKVFEEHLCFEKKGDVLLVALNAL